ncbi:MAG: glucose-6-phosphate isomerase [Bryobacteraceae bacterium]
MNIQFDSTNLLQDMVGGQGVSRAEVREHAAEAIGALRAFRKASEEGRYGFPHLPFQSQAANEMLRFAGTVRGSYDAVCLVGIGGSALGAWAIDCALRGPHPVQPEFTKRNPRLVILDNVDPALVTAALDSMNPKRTLVVVIAKSGATAETVATFLIVREWMRKRLGGRAKERIVAVTSSGKGDLAALAGQEQYRTFDIPSNVGGRFSVLSPVGMLPAALTGVDIRKILQGACDMTHLCWQEDFERNVALRSALHHFLLWKLRNKPIQVAFPYSNLLWGTAFWFRQLWAESLGKTRTRAGETVHTGQTPVAALGTTDQHSQVQLYMEGPNDKVITFWAVGKHRPEGRIPKARLGLEAFDYLAGQSLARLLDAERSATAAALTEAQRPNCTFTLERVDAANLGAFLQMLEFQTAFMGELLNINAFDQPGVELGKQFTFGLMGRAGFESFRERFDAYEEKRKRLE